ncbi:MAG: hypothetical protein R2715_18345 [Ilumatobacteraceae bacterium]
MSATESADRPDRQPIPAGAVSSIRGRRQVPALQWVVRVLLVLAALGAALPGTAGSAFGAAAVAVLIATPLTRVAWLTFRWTQESDRRFVLTGLGLLTVVGIGAVLSALGVGR